MFYLSYAVSELRRRKGRTLLTALGVGLVVTVSALSAGLDKAQEKVLKPLTGVGTDMSVTRPIKIGSEPGEKFTRTDFMSAAQLSFPASQVAKIAALDGVTEAAGSLTLNAVTIKGTVPEGGFQRPQPGSQPQQQRAPFDVDSMSVTGVDESKSELAAAKLHAGDAREAVVNESYAKRHGISVGESVTLDGKQFKVIGLAGSPLGGQASDVYIKLSQLQKMSDREGRVNTVQVHADSSADVAAVESGTEDVRLDEIVAVTAGRVGRSHPDTRFELDLEPGVVEGLPDRLARAVGNLLDNAAKYGPPGGVVEVTMRDGELAVRDHGPGVPDADAPFVFDRCSRGKSAQGQPGSGLGLAIVRQVAESHGGEVTVEEAPGGGALFRLQLPQYAVVRAR